MYVPSRSPGSPKDTQYVHLRSPPLKAIVQFYRFGIDAKKLNRGNGRIIVFPSSKKHLDGNSPIYYPRNRKYNDKSDRSRSQ